MSNKRNTSYAINTNFVKTFNSIHKCIFEINRKRTAIIEKRQNERFEKLYFNIKREIKYSFNRGQFLINSRLKAVNIFDENNIMINFDTK